VKKTRIAIAILVLLLLCGGIFWLVERPEEKIVVHGNLPAKDLAEIKRVVRSEMRRQVFAHFSWSTVKALPAKLMELLHKKIETINVETYAKVFVEVDIPPKYVVPSATMPPVSMTNDYKIIQYFMLRTNTNGWASYPPEIFNIRHYTRINITNAPPATQLH
jgi:hypothetical protein